jgi:flavin-dependent dehydrogenase
MKSADIVIIGAGPAGCMLAFLLASNFNVLILEQKKLPRKKSCSGVLIKKSVEIIELYVGSIPENVKCKPETTNGLVIHTSSGETYDFQDNGINILRERFDHWLLQQAQLKGAQITDNSVILEIVEEADGAVLTVKTGNEIYKIQTNLIIACDGVFGTSRKLMMVEPLNRVITLQKYFRGVAPIDPAKFYAFTSPEYSGYDAWINTKDEIVIIGTMAETLPKARAYFEEFSSYLMNNLDFRLQEEISEEIWAIPLVIPDTPIVYRKGKVFYAGEIAGFLNPFGEGISIALKSAIALSSACKKELSTINIDYDSLEKNYIENMASEVRYMRNQWSLIKDLSPEFWKNAIRN